jgi:hypothetical protein
MRELLTPPKVRRVPERDVDRSPEFRWLAEHGPDYRGQWVALVGEELLGSASSIEGLLATLEGWQTMGRKPLLHRID